MNCFNKQMKRTPAERAGVSQLLMKVLHIVIIYMGRIFKERDVFMKVIVCKDYDREMSIKAAEFIAEEMNKKNFVLGLATGSTPVGTYKNLIKMNTNKEIDFSDVVTFNLDEYIGLDKTTIRVLHISCMKICLITSI